MGYIQDKFNQLLGIGAIGMATVGKEMGQHKMEQNKLANEGDKLDKELDKAIDETSVIESQMADYENAGGDKRLKAYRSLKTQLGEKQVQMEGFAERIKNLKERELIEENRFKKGLFGMNKTFEKSKAFNKEVDDIVRGEE